MIATPHPDPEEVPMETHDDDAQAPDPTPPALAPGTKHRELFEALAAPFARDEVKVLKKGGRDLHYITARTAMNRLDEVVGPENWSDHYLPGEHSVICILTITLPDGRTLSKEDAGGYAWMSDAGDDNKSGFSDAFKRACAKFGIARYLYRDGIPNFAKALGLKTAAELPTPQARRPAPREEAPGPRREPAPQRNGERSYDGPPRSGKALFAWTRDQENRGAAGLLKHLNTFIKQSDFPPRMVDLSPEEVAIVHAEAVRKLGGVEAGVYDEAGAY